MLTDIQKGGKVYVCFSPTEAKGVLEEMRDIVCSSWPKAWLEEPQRNKMMVGLGKMLEWICVERVERVL